MPQQIEPRPERAQTDDSLATERSKADDALARTAIIEREADDVVARARDDADEVLLLARARADEAVALPARRDDDAAALEQQRRSEDQAVERERASADAALHTERAANARILARLLPIERNNTDRYLLTERARSDDAVANRDDFLGMVSHDLRDLLGAIATNATLILDQQGTDAAGSAAFVGAQRIERLAARMNRLIGDLVDMAAIDAGKLTVRRTAGDVCAVLADAVEIWNSVALTKGVALEALSPVAVPGAAAVEFDHERILQVLGNLITNAIKFSPPGAAVVVGLEEVGGEARFSVKDSGVGIPDDKHEAIFQRFWQVGKNDRRGLGLGLYISKCLVEEHGGRIWVDSAIGAGSTFLFTIPR